MCLLQGWLQGVRTSSRCSRENSNMSIWIWLHIWRILTFSPDLGWQSRLCASALLFSTKLFRVRQCWPADNLIVQRTARTSNDEYSLAQSLSWNDARILFNMHFLLGKASKDYLHSYVRKPVLGIDGGSTDSGCCTHSWTLQYSYIWERTNIELTEN